MIPLSIVIPAYNEARRLPATLDRLLHFLAQQHPSAFEILVVDDGSRDETAAVVKDYMARHPSISLLQYQGNRGKGYAVRHGMLKARGLWILSTDADLSAPIEDLPALQAAAQRAGARVAIGSRAIERSLVTVHQSFFREFSGRVFNLILKMIVGLPYKDTQCGFKLFEAAAAREIFSRQLLDGFSFDVEDLAIAKVRGIPVVEVPVRWSNVEGTKVTLSQGLRSFSDLLVIRWNMVRGRYHTAPLERAAP